MVVFRVLPTGIVVQSGQYQNSGIFQNSGNFTVIGTAQDSGLYFGLLSGSNTVSGGTVFNGSGVTFNSPVIQNSGNFDIFRSGGSLVMGQISITSGAAGGSGAALPTNAQRYLTVNISGVSYKIPMFNT